MDLERLRAALIGFEGLDYLHRRHSHFQKYPRYWYLQAITISRSSAVGRRGPLHQAAMASCGKKICAESNAERKQLSIDK